MLFWKWSLPDLKEFYNMAVVVIMITNEVWLAMNNKLEGEDNVEVMKTLAVIWFL